MPAMTRPDILADLNRFARLRREEEDFRYIRSHHPDQRGYAVDLASGLINRAAGPGHEITAHDGSWPDDGVVMCGRVDLDHPIRFPDNQFAACDDCATSIQFRPAGAGAKIKLCICCAAPPGREQINSRTTHFMV